LQLTWNEHPELTLLIRRVQAGDKNAEREFFRVGYQHLRSLAANYLNRESLSGHQTPEDLLHDVYLSRLRSWAGDIQNRHHYTALVCLALRKELCDQARRRKAWKRTPPPLAEGRGLKSRLCREDVLDIEREIDRLTEVDPRAAQVVCLRYYGGCSLEETGRATGASIKEVRNDWDFAARWLSKRLGRRLFC
jgi:RNA polymerase sigma factor (TIGR02999 family)